MLIAHRLKKVERSSLEISKPGEYKFAVADKEPKQIGIECTVFEREQYLNERGRDWSFGIYWAQEPVAECVTQANLKRMPAAYVDEHRLSAPDDFIPIFNSATGEQLTRIPTPNSLRLQRIKFRSVLAKGIDIQVGFINRNAGLALTNQELVWEASS